MPELPEVETIKEILKPELIGQRILNIKVLKPKLFWGNPKDVIGSKISSLSRRAKVLIINLGGDKSLLIHFKMSGQLLWQRKNALPAKTTHVIFELSQGALFFNDLRQFGWIKVLTTNQLEKALAKYGPEPLSSDFTLSYLEKILRKSRKPIKLLLMDQPKIAGVGNIYANDALFFAGIKPTRASNSLTKKEIMDLRKSIIKVLKEGIKYQGSSAKDEAYVKPTGEHGQYQNHFKVYQQQGKTCPRCGSQIKRISLGGRGTFYCPKCQK